MERKTQIAAVAVVVIVIVAAVAVYFMTKDDGKSTETGDRYYFYLDGFEDLDGWYDATGDGSLDAFDAAMSAAGIKYTNNNGLITIEDFVGSGNYDEATKIYTGVGNGIFTYTSTSTEYPNPNYFVAGPAIGDVASNIVYISFGEYTMGTTTKYDLNPTSTTHEDLMTTGPFSDPDYRPLPVTGEFWFYLDGFDDISGWYKGTGDSPMEGFESAMTAAGITYTNNNGMITIGDFIGSGSYDEATNTYTGEGNGIFVIPSKDISYAMPSYFKDGPALEDVAGNVVYISFGNYTMVGMDTTYELCPTTTESDFMTTGPFAA